MQKKNDEEIELLNKKKKEVDDQRKHIMKMNDKVERERSNMDNFVVTSFFNGTSVVEIVWTMVPQPFYIDKCDLAIFIHRKVLLSVEFLVYGHGTYI